MSFIVKVENVSKVFKDELVLNDLSLSIKKGTIVGIVGRNGSGKSILFKIISGLYIPTKGKVIVFDEDITELKTFPKKTRAIIDEPKFLENHSGFNNLRFLASLSRNTDRHDIEGALTKVGLKKSDWNKKVKKYSLGMKQKLAFAQVIMDNPELIILDEPFNGLDDTSVNNFHNIIMKLKEEGVTIILASHIKEDIEKLSDEIYKIDSGKLTVLQKLL